MNRLAVLIADWSNAREPESLKRAFDIFERVTVDDLKQMMIDVIRDSKYLRGE